jgi:hypothetical protein
MLFNSYEFILLFLPIVVLGFFARASSSSRGTGGPIATDRLMAALK